MSSYKYGALNLEDHHSLERPSTPAKLTTADAQLGVKDQNALPDPKLPHLIRCGVFLILEVAYIALAASLQIHPIPLPQYTTYFKPSSVRSMITTISIVWHTTAAMFALDILADSFSREWSIKPTDRVSTITSGIRSRVSHLFNPASTRTFKLSLVVSVLIFILLRIGPSTIIASNKIEIQKIPIGGLILGSSDMSQQVLNVEQVLGINTGYDTEPNWIIPRPAYNTTTYWPSLAIGYDSDLVYFKHTCEWHAPVFNVQDNTVVIGGQTFDFQGFTPISNDTQTATGTSISLLEQSNPTNSTSGFLIFGGNSSIPVPPGQTGTVEYTIKSIAASFIPDSGTQARALPATVGFTIPETEAPVIANNTINLSGLPTVYHPGWFNFSTARFNAWQGGEFVFSAPLATSLLCDSHPALHTGPVSLTLNKLTANASASASRVGNIDPGDLPSFFSNALVGINDAAETFMVPSPSNAKQWIPVLMDFSPAAAQLFVNSPPNGSDWLSASLSPFSLDEIANKIDASVLSVSKVQRVEGIEGSGEFFFPNGSNTMEVRVTMTLQEEVFAADPLYLYFTSGLIFGVFLTSVILAILINKHLSPFDLRHILAFARKHPELFEKAGL